MCSMIMYSIEVFVCLLGHQLILFNTEYAKLNCIKFFSSLFLKIANADHRCFAVIVICLSDILRGHCAFVLVLNRLRLICHLSFEVVLRCLCAELLIFLVSSLFWISLLLLLYFVLFFLVFISEFKHWLCNSIVSDR